MLFSQKKIGCRARNGLSVVEFVGCLVALGGGLVLGLIYLGFDVKSMAGDALQQAKTIENSYFNETTEEAAQADSEPSALNAENNSTGIAKQEPGEQTLPETAVNQVDGEVVAVDESVREEKSIPRVETPAEVDPEIATKIYWIALTDCMRVESRRRKDGGATSDDWRLFDHLMHRKTGHEEAVAVLEKLDDTSVDQRLVAHAHQVLSWHRAGMKLYGRAVDLLTDGPSSGLVGPTAQSWQSAATQLRMEEKLVRGKHAGVAGYLNHTYKSQTPFSPAVSR